MFETKVVWFLSAAALAATTSLVAFKDVAPSPYQWVVVGIGAIAQGLLAYRAFVQQPPQ